MLCARPGLQGIVGPKLARACTTRRSRASTRTRARDGTGAHAHAHICAHIRTRPSPPARAPTRAARLSGGTRRAVVVGGGASGGGRLSPRKPLVGREELRRTQPGTARCAAERSGGAAGGCSGLWAARAGQRQMGALITETARTDAPLTRTRHAWVVRRLERGSTGHAAPYLLTGIAHLR